MANHFAVLVGVCFLVRFANTADYDSLHRRDGIPPAEESEFTTADSTRDSK